MGSIDRFAIFAEHANRLDGFITLDEASRLDVTRQELLRWCTVGLVGRVGPGVYRLSNLPWTWETNARRALLSSTDDAGLGFRSALVVWDVEGIRKSRVELIVPRWERRRTNHFSVRESLDLAAGDLTDRRGFRLTRIERSLIDSARFLDSRSLAVAVSDAIRRDLTTYDALALRFLELAKRGRRGVVKMRHCLADRTELIGPAATSFERDFEVIVERGGFPKPIRQHRVDVDGRVFYLDHAWLEFGCWGECDSMLAHSTPEQLQSDLERQNLIIQATGLTPLRFTYRDVHDRPDYVDHALARYLPRLHR